MGLDREGYLAKRLEWISAVRAAQEAHRLRDEARNVANTLAEEEFALRQPFVERIQEFENLEALPEDASVEAIAARALFEVEVEELKELLAREE